MITKSPTFTVQINDVSPIYYYCAQGTHCHLGMVGGINAPSSPPQSVEDYGLAAAALRSTVGNNNANGGESDTSSTVTSRATTSTPAARSTSTVTGKTGQSPTSSSTNIAIMPLENGSQTGNVSKLDTGTSAGLVAGTALGSAAIILAAAGLWIWWRQMPHAQKMEKWDESLAAKEEIYGGGKWTPSKDPPQEMAETEVQEKLAEVAATFHRRQSIYELGLGR